MTDYKGHPFQIVLVDDLGDDDNGAEPKFNIKGPRFVNGGEQPEHLVDVDIGDNALVVQCNLDQVIHGAWAENGTSQATIAIFQFAFVPRRGNRRFLEADIKLTFSDGDIVGISPAGPFAIDKSSKTHEISHSINPSIQAAVGAATASLGYQWQMKETGEIEGQASVHGFVRALGTQGDTKSKNTAIWLLKENSMTGSGIPTFLQTALLLKREPRPGNPPNNKFSARLEITGKVDRRTRFHDMWESTIQNMSGSSSKGSDIIFDPENSRGTVKDLKNMNKEDLRTYSRLVTIEDWVDNTDAAGLAQKNDGPQAEKENTEQVQVYLPHEQQVAETQPKDEPVQMNATAEYVTAEQMGVSASLSPTSCVRRAAVLQKSGMETHAFPTHDSSILAGPGINADETYVKSDREVERKRKRLQEELSNVKMEADLIRRLLRLGEEERRILQELAHLEDS